MAANPFEVLFTCIVLSWLFLKLQILISSCYSLAVEDSHLNSV